MAGKARAENGGTRRPPPELFDRFAAKAIDGAIWLLCAALVPPAGTVFGVLFWLFSDGFGGASPGKRVVGLMVLQKFDRRPAGLKESTLRNIPFAVPALLLLLPAGPVFCAVVGIPVLILESYFLLSDPDEARIGDIFADSVVVSIKPKRRRGGSNRVKAPFDEG